MTDRTMTAMYDTRGAAQTAQDQLIELGVAVDDVAIRSIEGGESAASSGEDRGFWASLSDLFMPDEDRHTYAEGVKRGGYLLSARVPDGLQDAAADILEACDPIDLDQRSETWRQEGWTGYETSADAPAKAAYGEGVTCDGIVGPKKWHAFDYLESAKMSGNDRLPADQARWTVYGTGRWMIRKS